MRGIKDFFVRIGDLHGANHFPQATILVLGLLSGFALLGFIGSSLLEGKKPFVTRGEARQACKAGFFSSKFWAQGSAPSSFNASPLGRSRTAEKKVRDPASQTPLV